MPWWSKELWTLRDQLRKAYQQKTNFPSSDSLNKYAAVKSNYQRFLRRSKSESFKNFCSTELNDDIFKSLKKLANISTASCPSAIRVQGATITEPFSILLYSILRVWKVLFFLQTQRRHPLSSPSKALLLNLFPQMRSLTLSITISSH